MKTVAIICEYNPFHNGHLYQIDEIRREFGAETRIIAIMSGNYTQRGETAILDKVSRAKCAVLCGVNLVLELPFPFSVSSAELFAKAAVHIANNLAIVDYLSFGSESGNIVKLTEYAKITLEPEYNKMLEEAVSSSKSSALGYPALCERVYREYTGDAEMISLTPNNILAVEYIKALIRTNSDIRPHTVKRSGASYDEEAIIGSGYQSATAIRNAVNNKDISALEYVPIITKQLYLDSISSGDFPCDAERLSSALISKFRLNPSDAGDTIHDAKGGLYNRLKNASLEASTLQTLISLTETKKYTKARIKRAIWYSFFGVTSSEVKADPAYTQILAMDGIGKSCLKQIRKQTSFPILTKPSMQKELDEIGKKQKARADAADSVFELTKPIPKSGATPLTLTPFIKNV